MKAFFKNLCFKSNSVRYNLQSIGAGIDMPYLEEIGGYKDVRNSFTYMLRAGILWALYPLYIFSNHY